MGTNRRTGLSRVARAVSAVLLLSTICIPVYPQARSERIPPTNVPDLQGRTLREADLILSRAGLVRGAVSQRPSERPAGTVIAQRPMPRTAVPRGTAVDMTIAANVLRVPDLTGQTFEQAEEILADANLRFGGISEQPSDRRPGTVIAQSPKPGVAVRPDAIVTVVLAAQLTMQVPNLIGRTVGEADEILAEMGLQRGGVAERPSDQRPGTVVDQFPRPGEPANTGVRVNLVVAGQFLVPNLLGRTVPEADELLSSVGLRRGIVSMRLSERRPGTVVSQSPGPESPAEAGMEVDLIVAGQAAVPDLTGRTLEQADEILRRMRLRRGSISEQTSDRPPRTVIGQSPRPQTPVEPGGTVDLVLAAAPILVPDLTGYSVSEAGELLREVGLVLGSVYQRPSTETAGSVIAQSPQPNTPAREETPVNVAIAVAPQPSEAAITVPNLFGQTPAEASETLRESGLRLGSMGNQYSPEPYGTVVGQTPESGAPAQPGTEVNVVLSGPPNEAEVFVPDLIGMTVGRASQALRERGLGLGSVTNSQPNRPSATIVSQTPPPYTEVSGGTVDVLLGLPQQVEPDLPLVVPDLRGQTEAAAAELLAQNGLRLGDVGEARAEGEPGTVVGQEPAAGTEVEAESAVSVVLAAGLVMPDLVGLSREEAEQVLAGLPVGLGEVGSRISLRSAGTVVWQRPAAGTSIASGMLVDLGVAQGVSIGWVASGFAAVLAIAAVGFGVSRRGKKKNKPDWTAQTVNLRPLPDRGMQRLRTRNGKLTGPALSLRARRDLGRQRVVSGGPLLG